MNKMDSSVTLLNTVEPINDAIRRNVVWGDVEVIGVDVQLGPQEEICQYHNNGEKLFVTHSVFQLGIIEFV